VDSVRNLVFFSSASGIYRCNMEGGDYITLVETTSATYTHMTVDDVSGVAYVANPVAGTILRFATTSTSMAAVEVQDGAEARGLAVDTLALPHHILYWSESGRVRMKVVGAEGLQLASDVFSDGTGTAQLEALAVYRESATHRFLYWLDSNGPALHRLRIGDAGVYPGAVPELVGSLDPGSGLGAPRALAVDSREGLAFVSFPDAPGGGAVHSLDIAADAPLPPPAGLSPFAAHQVHSPQP
jgi:hypothetical protein